MKISRNRFSELVDLAEDPTKAEMEHMESEEDLVGIDGNSKDTGDDKGKHVLQESQGTSGGKLDNIPNKILSQDTLVLGKEPTSPSMAAHDNGHGPSNNSSRRRVTQAVKWAKTKVAPELRVGQIVIPRLSSHGAIQNTLATKSMAHSTTQNDHLTEIDKDSAPHQLNAGRRDETAPEPSDPGDRFNYVDLDALQENVSMICALPSGGMDRSTTNEVPGTSPLIGLNELHIVECARGGKLVFRVLKRRILVIPWVSLSISELKRLVFLEASDYFGMKIIQGYPHFIHGKVLCGSTWCHLIVVCGPPSPTRRQPFWRDLDQVIGSIIEPLFIEGDFNGILSIDERRGGSCALSSNTNIFTDLVSRHDLIDLGFSGSRFTWSRGNEGNPVVDKRLDRVFINNIGRLKWESAVVRHLPTICFDHNPLYLSLTPFMINDRSRRPFCFKAMWISHPTFMSIVSNSWATNPKTSVALSKLRDDLRKWNRKDKITARLNGIKSDLNHGGTHRLLKLRASLRKELDEVLAQEELLWYQKSRVKWIECGDRNTAFFHTSTIIRR
ncbi:hypothetical protein V2J09_009568 [Rumex salicifolius]